MNPPQHPKTLPPSPPKSKIEDRLKAELVEAEEKAWDALARYKFWMFGYWAAIWVHLNRTGGFKLPNPFKSAVELARTRRKPLDKG